MEYHKIKADRSKTPRRQDFNRLYSTFCKENFGSKNGAEMFECLTQRISEYKQENEESSIDFQRYEDFEDVVTPFIMVIITPLMKRVHEMVNFLKTLL